MDKRFTIVVCTHNGSRYLPQVLDAILELDLFKVLVNEVMVVDNRSTDNTKDIILSYASKEELIKYHYEPKQGLSFARRHAVEANSQWVIYVDDDNLLQRNWLTELNKTIEENPEVGVINGAVIAHCPEKLTNEQRSCLNVMYHNLACTHLSEEHIQGSKPNYIPMGAGMCVRVDAIKSINKEGWLTLTGRSGTSLASGEDTELSSRIFEQGYTYICNYKMRLKHIIPSTRLSNEYMSRLIVGLTNGRYDYISNQKFYVISRFLRCIKYILLIAYWKTIEHKSVISLENDMKNRYQILSAKTFLNRTKNDFLFGRN